MNLLCVSESLCVYDGRVVYREFDYVGAGLSSLSRGRLTSEAGEVKAEGYGVMCCSSVWNVLRGYMRKASLRKRRRFLI